MDYETALELVRGMVDDTMLADHEGEVIYFGVDVGFMGPHQLRRLAEALEVLARRLEELNA